jgi:8-oxo-dGTP pyrophosphatase MutT (NUDIX family)
MPYHVAMLGHPEDDLPVKRSIALVIRHPRDERLVLVVRRPPDDEDLPNAWGLPAGSLRPTESWSDAVERAAREKLGVPVRFGAVVNEGTMDRKAYRLHMRLYAATIPQGEPRLDNPANEGTRYVDWKWDDSASLQPAAEAGSFCSRLLLESL